MIGTIPSIIDDDTDTKNNKDYNSITSSSLIKLKLDHNEISGTMPSSFINLKSLEVLCLSNNLLRGTFPMQLKDLHTLGK